MKSRITLTVLVAASALLLSACTTNYGDPSAPANDPYATETSEPATTSGSEESPAAEPDSTTASGVSLATLETDLGTIVTDGDGMVVYQFDSDTQGSGASSCDAGCLGMWPAVPGGDEALALEGVTGEVTTITGTDGNPQLALNGWPLYYYAGDAAAGDTTGQAVGGVWWVVDPAGEPIRD